MNERPMMIDRFALRPGMNRGDSVLLLDEARHREAFDSFPGRYAAIAVLASAETPAALDALQALEDSRRFLDSGKAAFFAAIPGLGPDAELARRFPSIRFLEGAGDWVSAFGAGPEGCWVIVSPMLRVVDIVALSNRERAFGLLERLPTPGEASRTFVARPDTSSARGLRTGPLPSSDRRFRARRRQGNRLHAG